MKIYNDAWLTTEYDSSMDCYHGYHDGCSGCAGTVYPSGTAIL